MWALGAAATRDDGWAQVAEGLGLAADHLVRVHQVHGTAVLVIRDNQEPIDARIDADIIVSDAADYGVGIQTADCVPLLIADSRSGGVAAAHAGWRGLAAEVPIRTVERLSVEFGARPGDLVAAIGPSIGSCCYEVGNEVRERFEAAAGSERWFSREPRDVGTHVTMPSLAASGSPRRWFFDGAAAAHDQLVKAGLAVERIHSAALCTANYPEVFCSYRRDGTGAGRIAGAIRSGPLDPDPWPRWPGDRHQR
jgi:YfiH family protein